MALTFHGSFDSKAREEGGRGRAIRKTPLLQLITNLAIKLLVERFRGCAIKSNHLERDD